MIINKTSNLYPNQTRSVSTTSPYAASTPKSSSNSDTLNISHAAYAALAADENQTTPDNIESRLAKIKEKDALSRTSADWDYLFANDKQLAEITAKANKNPYSLSAAEVDYEQKARGFVNTMGNLSSQEKALYDKAVASGDTQAAAGISQIAFIRTMGNIAGGADGTTYDPSNMPITADNIQKYFSQSIVDPSGKTQSQFQALIQYLNKHPVTS